MSNAPLDLTVGTAAENWVDVTWIAPANTGTQPLEGYALFYSLDGGTSWALSGTVPAEQLSYRFGALLSSTIYLLTAQALTTAGTSEFSNSASFETVDFAPGIVGNVVLVGSGCSTESCGGQITLTPPSAVGVGTLFYEVGYSVDAGATWIFVAGKPWSVSDNPNEIQFSTHPIPPEQQNGLLIVVRASTQFGVGTPSDPIGF